MRNLLRGDLADLGANLLSMGRDFLSILVIHFRLVDLANFLLRDGSMERHDVRAHAVRAGEAASRSSGDAIDHADDKTDERAEANFSNKFGVSATYWIAGLLNGQHRQEHCEHEYQYRAHPKYCFECIASARLVVGLVYHLAITAKHLMFGHLGPSCRRDSALKPVRVTSSFLMEAEGYAR